MVTWNHSTGARTRFTRSLFDVYDEHLVPLVFQSYADELPARLDDLGGGALLETAAGTGVVTRALAAALPADVAITATDLVPGMIARAERAGTTRPVTWEQADALALPYEDQSFDAVVCQFGAMFFPAKAAAFAEARRVLRPGGRFLCTVWDRLDANELPAAVNAALKEVFPADPPGFLERTPYAYHDVDTIVGDLRAGGFEGTPAVEELAHVNPPTSPMDVATALCAGTPLHDEIDARGAEELGRAIDETASLLAARLGPGDLRGRTRALLVAVTR